MITQSLVGSNRSRPYTPMHRRKITGALRRFIISPLHIYTMVFSEILSDTVVEQAVRAYLWRGLLLLRLLWTLFVVGRLCVLRMWMMVGVESL